MNKLKTASAMSARPDELLRIRLGRIARRRTGNGIGRGRLLRASENVTTMHNATNRPGRDVLFPTPNKTATTRAKTSTDYPLAAGV